LRSFRRLTLRSATGTAQRTVPTNAGQRAIPTKGKKEPLRRAALVNKNLKLNLCDYAFLRRNAMSEARLPKPANAGVVNQQF
jgi:hypothetical protein